MITFILVSQDRQNSAYLAEKLRGIPTASLVATCTPPELSVALARCSPDAVMLDISADPEKLLALASGFSVPVFVTCLKSKCEPDLLLAAMRLKVSEFIPIPFEDDLRKSIERLGHAMDANGAEPSSARGRLVCVISSKGGSGSTLIATSLATSLAKQARRSTALIDLNLQLGDVSLFLNLKPRATITDLVQQIDRLDDVLMRDMLTKHDTGVHVLAAPRRAEEAGLLSQSHLQTMYPMLKSMFEWVVVDLPVGFDDPLLGTLPHADVVFLVTLLSIPSLRNTKRYLEVLGRLGCSHDQIKIVVNRYRRRLDGDLDLKEAETVLGRPIFCSIPNDYPAVISSINQGTPLLNVAPKTPIVQAFHELARLLSDTNGAQPNVAHASIERVHKASGGFFTRMFRPAGKVR